VSPNFFSSPPHFSVEWGTIPHNFEILDATLYRKIFVSALLLCKYWLEINETLLEPSIPRGDGHIVFCSGQTF
jgi:hypothetical protein